jgi:hypothetical protein
MLPQMKLPPAEAELVRKTYQAAATILEYGSGGSTAFAASLPGKYVVAVESDPEWLAMLRAGFAVAPPVAELHLHHADVGPTGAWGAPLRADAFRSFPAYALGVWDQTFFRQPDVVLIDGRARPACLLATLFRTGKPVTVLFDDYVVRPDYRVVEQFARPARTVGRMAVFELRPTAIDPAKLTSVATIFASMMVDRSHVGRRLERGAKKLARRLLGR